ncbi:MAG: dimethyl sulfoxide reductase subunit A [Deferrisomatales bacterium]
MARRSTPSGEQVVTTCCTYDCGGRCVLRVHVAGGEVRRIGTEEGPGSGLRACGRGLAQGHVVRAPDRITAPLRRVGARGSGGFEAVSWDEALTCVAEALSRVKERYGPHAVFLMDSHGSLGALHSTAQAARRFFARFGGCTTRWGNTSLEGAIFASRATFGTAATGSTRDALLASRLIVLWGWNPVVTRFGPDTVERIEEARGRGARVVCVDPRRSPSAERLADQWIPIRPGTDGAILVAMAHVLLSEDRVDRGFVESCTVGAEAYADYVLGREDGVPKTPEWAEPITGVPAPVIAQLARDYASLRPAALCTGWAPGRSAFGEQFHRAAQALCALTGNLGVEGGWVAGGTGILPLGAVKTPLAPPRSLGPTVHTCEVYDALLEGTAGGYPSDVRLLYAVGSNFLNQHLNVNKGVRALEALDFVVVHELFPTATARYADVILPVSHFLEREDIGQPWAGGPYFLYGERALDPPPGVRSDREIFAELAARLGLEAEEDRSDEAWLRRMVEETAGLPDFESFREAGVHRLPLEGPWVAFREQVADPDKRPFRTPSGKIEIYSSRLAEAGDPQVPPIPRYLEPWEGPRDPLTQRYPLQLVTPHSRGRINSQGDNIPRMKALADDRLWLHPADARRRGIATGDRVRVFNDRGALSAVARVTEGVMEGVVSLDAGAWYRPDGAGTDLGGCVNVLTADRRSPGGAFPGSTCLVQVEKAAAEPKGS